MVKKTNTDTNTARAAGFTIVELLIVIVVIGILAGLVITTYNGVQQRARDATRKTAINAIDGQLETFYAQNGYYPLLSNMNTASWLSTNMHGLPATSLKDPKGSTAALATTPAASVYSYAVTASDGSSCDDVTTACTLFTLTATLEGGGTYAKKNLSN